MSKSFLASKTVWFNVVALAYGLVTYYHGPVTTVSPETVAFAASIVNIVLRFATSKSVTLTPAAA